LPWSDIELERKNPLGSWEQTISTFLHVFRLDSIKSKILVFALLGTLVPSLTMGWLYYVYNKRFLQGKITQEMLNVTARTVQEVDSWLKECFYDIRIFSTSYEVSENLEKTLRANDAATDEARALDRLKDYLNSVRKRFNDYEELLVFDPGGQQLATTAELASAVNLPPDWRNRATKNQGVVGDTYWDDVLGTVVMTIAVPITAANGRFLGVFAAKLNFRRIEEILKSLPLGKTGEVYLITQDGTLIIISQPIPLSFMKTKLTAETTEALLEKEGLLLEYRDYQGKDVVGTLKRMPHSHWGVVAATHKEEAYAQIARLQGMTVLMVTGLLLGIGLIAYLLGLIIVRPLDRLTDGVAKVAGGDLEVDLPIYSRGEVGYMTEVFNNMVARLRQGREELAAINKTLREKNTELEEISVTDALTGLYNRKHLMETLPHELARAQRYSHPFSVLMIDIDHFKKHNDTYGHLVGDRTLARMASIFTESVRSVDYVARYGGEEFLIMLPETSLEDALSAAERIRTRVAEEAFGDDGEKVRITVSIGVADFPEDGDTWESIIASADAVLYQAKQRGRNRVVSCERRAGKKGKEKSFMIH
jgi:diguanylate cyclase (GGDEF)-like protein